MRLDQIGIAQVDAYVQVKVREGRLGHWSINRTLSVLARLRVMGGPGLEPGTSCL